MVQMIDPIRPRIEGPEALNVFPAFKSGRGPVVPFVSVPHGILELFGIPPDVRTMGGHSGKEQLQGQDHGSANGVLEAHQDWGWTMLIEIR